MKQTTTGLGAFSILGILLVIGKLCGVAALIDVSWWLILLPFYFGLVVFGAVLVVWLIFAILFGIFSLFS